MANQPKYRRKRKAAAGAATPAPLAPDDDLRPVQRLETREERLARRQAEAAQERADDDQRALAARRARDRAEAARQAAEARREAEAQRQRNEAEAQALRAAEEDARRAAEEARRKAEAAARRRAEAEARRIAEEKARAEAEAKRQEAEARRAAAEKRKAEEKARAEAEAGRQEAEARRAAAEKRKAEERARAEAEAKRQEAEARRAAAEKRKAEERARAEAEARRQEAEARRAAAEKRKAEERARAEAEAKRQEAEARRAAAEKRKAEEKSRAEAEAKRQEAEARRAAAEKRKAEERARAEAEAKRQEAEARRAAAEKRKAEEKSRAEAEAKRQEAEAPLPLTNPLVAEPVPTQAARRSRPLALDADAAWAALDDFPVDAAHLARHRVVTASRDDPAHTAFDVLRTRLLQALSEHGWRRVAITSPTKDCGKTFTAANLAISLSRQENCRTLLLDCDMRQPSLHRVMGVSAPGSIGDLLRGRVTPREHLRRLGRNDFHAGHNIAFGFNGIAEPYASELLQDPRTAHALNSIEAQLEPDVVLFDLPPALFYDDVIAFRPLFDGVLLVIGGGITTEKEIKEVERRLGESTPLLGMILNKSEDVQLRRYRY